MPDDPLKEVSLRLERLEQKLDTVAKRSAVDAITEADIAASTRFKTHSGRTATAESTRPAPAC